MLTSDEEVSQVTRLFRIRKTVMQMLHDRGYLVTDDEINLTKSQFIDNYGEKIAMKELTVHKARRNESSDQINVFFLGDSVGVKQIETYSGYMKSDKVYRAIFVVQKNLSTLAKKRIADLSEIFHIEVFQEAELMFNIKDHELVPEHQLLTDELKKTLLERYNVKEAHLPRIQMDDPVARYYGLKRGDVVKITRFSDSAMRHVTYRYVV